MPGDQHGPRWVQVHMHPIHAYKARAIAKHRARYQVAFGASFGGSPRPQQTLEGSPPVSLTPQQPDASLGRKHRRIHQVDAPSIECPSRPTKKERSRCSRESLFTSPKLEISTLRTGSVLRCARKRPMAVAKRVQGPRPNAR